MPIADIRPSEERIARHVADGWWAPAGEPSGVAFQVRNYAKSAPDKTLVVDRLGSATYREIEEQAARLAHGLRARGVGKRDGVLVQLPNWREALVIHLALESIGAVTVPLPPIYRAREVGFIARLTEAKAIFVIPAMGSFDMLDMIRSLQPELPALQHVIAVESDGTTRDRGAGVSTFASLIGDARLDPAEADEIARDPNAIIEIGFTSGSTGDPKGVPHTSNTLCTEHRVVVQAFELGDADVVFMPSTVGHQLGWCAMRMTALIGATLVLIDRWDATAAVELMTREKATFTITTPAFVYDVLGLPSVGTGSLPSFRSWLQGGQVVTSALHDACLAKLPHIRFANVFGMTEMGCTIMTDVRSGAGKALATGRAQPSVEAKAIEDEELAVRSASLFLGYYSRDDLTQESFTEDGFFRTGDQITIDADGFIKVSGRIKDLIKRGGESVSPGEIEDILAKHPNIVAASVVGVPDTRLGERVCVFVVAKQGATITLEDIARFVGEAGLAKQKYPERLELIDALPRTSIGKVHKSVLRDIALERSAKGS